MQDKIVFRLKTETGGADPSSKGGDPSSAGGDLASSMSTLNESIKSLSSSLKTFNVKFSSIKDGLAKPQEPNYAQTTSRMRAEAYKMRSEFLNDPQGKEIQQARAESNLLRQQAEKQRQDMRSEILKRADEYKLGGDTKFAKKLESDVSESLSGGINKGVNQSGLAKVFTAIGGVAAIVGGAGKLFGAETTAGLSMMRNPYLNGYDYGGQVSGVMQANTQRGNAATGIGGAALGAIVGTMLAPGVGTLIGGSLGSSAGSIFGAYNSSQTDLKSAAANTFVNNTMNAQALSATNQAATGIYTQGMYNRRITDSEQPLILAMSKAAGVYNRNFKEIDKLTDYVRAGNMSIQQGAGLSGAVSFLTQGMNAKQQGSFVDKMKQSFSAYGVVDPASTATNAMLFKQAGMGASDAAELAARSSGLNQGAQGALSGFYGQNISSRFFQDYISKNVYGVNLPNVVSGQGDSNAAKYRSQLLRAEKSGSFAGLDPRAIGFEQLYNLTNYQTTSKQSDLRNIGSTIDQKRIQDITNQTTANNAQGLTLDKAIGVLNGEVNATASSLTGLSAATAQLTTGFQSLSSWVTSKFGGNPAPQPHTLATPSKPKSGDTGTHYTVDDYYRDNPKYTPEAVMKRFNTGPLSHMSLKEQVKL